MPKSRANSQAARLRTAALTKARAKFSHSRQAIDLSTVLPDFGNENGSNQSYLGVNQLASQLYLYKFGAKLLPGVNLDCDPNHDDAHQDFSYRAFQAVERLGGFPTIGEMAKALHFEPVVHLDPLAPLRAALQTVETLQPLDSSLERWTFSTEAWRNQPLDGRHIADYIELTNASMAKGNFAPEWATYDDIEAMRLRIGEALDRAIMRGRHSPMAMAAEPDVALALEDSFERIVEENDPKHVKQASQNYQARREAFDTNTALWIALLDICNGDLGLEMMTATTWRAIGDYLSVDPADLSKGHISPYRPLGAGLA